MQMMAFTNQMSAFHILSVLGGSLKYTLTREETKLKGHLIVITHYHFEDKYNFHVFILSKKKVVASITVFRPRGYTYEIVILDDICTLIGNYYKRLVKFYTSSE